jgi:hypothetical protein
MWAVMVRRFFEKLKYKQAACLFPIADNFFFLNGWPSQFNFAPV